MRPHERRTESTGTRWIPIAEVEALIGKRERNARYWLERHDIPARGERLKLFAEAAIVAKLAELGQAARKAPEHVPEYPPEATGMPPERPARMAEPIEAAYQVAGEAPPVALVPLATMVEELRGLADQLADLAPRNEGLALEVGTLRERVAGHEGQLVAKDETIAELRRRADLTEQEAAGLRARLSAAVVAQDERDGDRGIPEASDAENAPGGGLWGKVRRWWTRDT
jgi:hypothetical protein